MLTGWVLPAPAVRVPREPGRRVPDRPETKLVGLDNRTSRRKALQYLGAVTGLAACGARGAAGAPGTPAWQSAVEAQRSVEELADRVRGPVLVPGDQG
jgi:hypothetical protein